MRSVGSGWGFGCVGLMLFAFVIGSRYYGARATPEGAIGGADDAEGGVEMGTVPLAPDADMLLPAST